MSIGALDTFGWWHSQASTQDLELGETRFINRIERLNKFSAVPIIAQMCAVARINMSVKEMSGDGGKITAFHVVNIIRGIADFIFLGVLMNIIDAIVQLGRSLKSCRSSNEGSQGYRTVDNRSLPQKA